MLRHQFKLAGTMLLSAALFFIVWSVYDYITSRNLFGSIMLLMYGLIFLFAAMIAYRKMKRTEVINEPDNIEHHTKFIVEKEIALYNQFIIYSPEGCALGRYKPSSKGIKNKLFSVFENFIRVLPFTHVIEDMNGKEILTIDIKGMRNPEFIVYDQTQEIGRVKQQKFKSLTKYVFEVTTEEGVMTIQSEAIISDLELPGIVNIYTDKVPLKYSRTFNQLTLEVGELTTDMTTAKGKLGLAMIVIYKSLRTK